MDSSFSSQSSSAPDEDSDGKCENKEHRDGEGNDQLEKVFEANVERMDQLTRIGRIQLSSDFFGESLKGVEAQILEQVKWLQGFEP